MMEPVEWMAREMICNCRENLLSAPGFERSKDFTIERAEGLLVWRMFDLVADQPMMLDGLMLHWNDQPFAYGHFPSTARLHAGDIIHVTYRLEWRWRGGNDDDPVFSPGPPGKGRIFRAAPVVPHLSDWHKLAFSLSC